MNQPIELITHKLCPYVQRSVIVLEEKGIDYRRTDIDLANKPAWFAEVSPLGKVPVLITGERRSLFESAVICEYLNDITPGSLHPEDDLERAEHRAWIEFGSGILNRIAALYNAASEAAFDAGRQQLVGLFQQLESRLGEGPYFSGTDFRIIDAVYGPIFRYFDVLDTELDLAVFQDVPKVQGWRRHLAQRPTVQRAVSPDYPERLLTFVQQRGSHLAGLLSKAA